MELTYGCNCSCGDFEDKKVAGAKLTMGNGDRHKPTYSAKWKTIRRNYHRGYDRERRLHAIRQQFRILQNRLQVGDAVYLKVNVAQSKFKPDRLDVNIEEIQNLDNVQGRWRMP